jgi:hypothetical protein
MDARIFGGETPTEIPGRTVYPRPRKGYLQRMSVWAPGGLVQGEEIE